VVVGTVVAVEGLLPEQALRAAATRPRTITLVNFIIGMVSSDLNEGKQQPGDGFSGRSPMAE
jgi:hypothetical protein